MYRTTLDQREQVDQEFFAVDAASLYQAFERVKDGRGKKGKRYPLAFLLTVILLGKMAGETKLEGIIDWVNERKQEIKKILHWPKDFPVANTYRNALEKCDHQEITKAIAQVIIRARAIEWENGKNNRLFEQREQNSDTLIHTAVDGKILRGTLKHAKEDQPPVHLLSFYECESGVVLDQFLVEKTKNEESVGKARIHPVLVKGRIITTDAIFTSRSWCAAVDAYKGYYMTPIKGNNKEVLYNLLEYFGDEELLKKECEYYKDVDKGHGRREVREIWASSGMNIFFQKDWAGIAQVFLIRRTVKEKEEEKIELAFGITNLPRKYANARRLLELNREHWLIENRLHYRRDVTLQEDASQVRSRGVPEVIAALNGGILALMDFLGVRNVAKQMRHFCAQPQEVRELLLGNLSRAKRVN